MDEYFVHDGNFSAKSTSGILACKAVSTDLTYNTGQNILKIKMCNVFDKLVSEYLG